MDIESNTFGIPIEKKVTTHPHFKSVDPKFKDVETINECVGVALKYQHLFEKWMCDDDKCESVRKNQALFKIDLGYVDRLYNISWTEHEKGKPEFTLAGRQNYEGHQIFFHMYGGFEPNGVGGRICITSNPDQFMLWVEYYPHLDEELIETSLDDDEKTV